MPIYVNRKRHDIHLAGPDGQVVGIKAGVQLELPTYFDKYINYGLLMRADDRPNTTKDRSRVIAEARRIVSQTITIAPATTRPRQRQIQRQPQHPGATPIVGKQTHEDAIHILRYNLQRGGYPISNNIGVGILSYNRPRALQRLITSIRRYTDLNRTTIFVSDDGSTDATVINILEEINDMVVLRNQLRLGIAGNTNRLLQCLSRFRHMILLNDDVEILANDWEYVYPNAAGATGFKHFIYRQEGVYGAGLGEPTTVGGVGLRVVREKPHGAVLYANSDCLAEVGYFDERFGIYGLEHVDWSTKVFERGLQPSGYWDVMAASAHFRIHAEPSAIEGRVDHLHRAKQVWQQRDSARAVPGVLMPAATIVVPCRNVERTESICTVIRNLRALRFPVLQLILVEQDRMSSLDLTELAPLDYKLVPGEQLFNKSLAFNHGVALAQHELLILHDADTLAPANYVVRAVAEMGDYDACHIGAKMIYADQPSTVRINDMGVDESVHFERVVGYYEGGSIICTRAAYWSVGGFNESFVGYGCEDCDFYYRLAGGTKFRNYRCVDLLHLWHSRIQGWEEAHKRNKQIESHLRAVPLLEYLERQRAQTGHYQRIGE